MAKKINFRPPIPRRRYGESKADFKARTIREIEKERKRQRDQMRKDQTELRDIALYNDKKRKERQSQKEKLKPKRGAFNREEYYKQHCTFPTKTDQDSATKDFEHRTKKIRHNHCRTCHRTGINFTMSRNKSVCSDCKKHEYTEDKLIREGMLPVWYDEDNEPRFRQPEELRCLRDPEKLLIQRLHTHVPAQHLKYGVIGVKGHVCAFPQDTTRVCNILPRLPSQCEVVQYMKTTKSRVIAGNEIVLFKVRRGVVLRALYWLKTHSKAYEDITIAETNMDWMDGKEEMELPATAEIEESEDDEDKGEEMEDLGPSPEINVKPREISDIDVAYNGIIMEDSPVIPSAEDREIADALEAAGDGNVVLNWPSVEERAISEISAEKIFPQAFPWLFPGGIGDIRDLRQKKLPALEWAKRLIMYEDSRFSTDKTFCFYVLNYCIRRRNRDSGNFFVNKFSSGCSGDIESLREAITNGKSNFINEISYFSKEIRGSDSFWRFKRDELHGWINHHVEMENGMPTYFITLSCADYYWPDIIRLVIERHFIATGETLNLAEGKKGRTQIINDHAAVIQEYFQKRVVAWMETVGRDIFGIRHYWIRYEFAPSRGQIHAHMLCISKDQSMQRAMYELRHNEEQQASVLAEWAERKIGLSALHTHPEEDQSKQEQNPVAMYYSDIKDKEDDLERLKGTATDHKCSGYCLRDSTKDDKEKYIKLHDLDSVPKSFKLKTCRFGGGTEATPNSGDTPGFPISNKPYFEIGASGYKRLRTKRNHPTVCQVSNIMLSSWRGNCDVQVFVYESDPDKPQYDEIARVTDYTVGYACKGGEKLKNEREQMIGLTNMYCDSAEDANVRSLSNKLLNRAASSRFISKPECLVLLLGLDLVKCTDRFDRINISGSVKVTKGKSKCSTVDKYQKRKARDNQTLHQFYHEQYNPKARKAQTNNKNPANIEQEVTWNIPHYTGMNVKPVFPPTIGYAKFVAVVHRPWKIEPIFSHINWEWDYQRYIASKYCPKIAKIADDQALERFVNKALGAVPTAKDPVTNDDMDPEMRAWLQMIGMEKQPDELHDPNELKFNYGIVHDWMSGNIIRPDSEDGKDWLINKIGEFNATEDSGLDLPKWRDGDNEIRDFEIHSLTDDQRDVMAYILNGIRRWLNRDKNFKGIRMIVNGKGGTGKTVLLKTITSTVRRMFQSKTSVVVSGPTGACSCHAGGKTDHSTFGLTSSNVNQLSVDKSLQKKLIPGFKDTIVCLFDERSMRESKVIGRMEITARFCAHGGSKTQTPWGGIPIIVQIGDDHQLPSYGKGVFFIPLPGCRDTRPPPEHNKMILHGNQVHLDFANIVMELPVIKRQKAGETGMRDRLERTRHDRLTTADINLLFGLHVNNEDTLKNKSVQAKVNKYLHVFANCAPRDQHNLKQLQEVSELTSNPVAILKSQYEGGPKNIGRPIRRHFANYSDSNRDKSRTPDRTLLCLGAKVSICGRNFMPEWGLYNSAIGTVKEIHFEKPEEGRQPNPNHGDLCDYIVVDFPGYKGPPWDNRTPTEVPVPVIKERCSKGCCIKRFVPLQLCFATTIHKMEGLTVGPNTSNSEPNTAEGMVVDIGSKQFESNCPGCFYTAYSRATTDGDGNPNTSAILFSGENISEHRLKKMTVRAGTRQLNIRVLRRNSWIKYLKQHTHGSGITYEEKQQLFKWARETKIDKSYIAKHIATTGYKSCVH